MPDRAVVLGIPGVPVMAHDNLDGTYTLITLSGGSTGSNEAHAGEVGGRLVQVGVELTRPNNSSGYVAKDAVTDNTVAGAATNLVFPNVARVAAGSGYITKVRVTTDLKTFAARLRLHLYHTAPAPLGDHAAFPLLYTNKDRRVGYVDLPAAFAEDAGSSTAAHSMNADVRLPFVCDAADRSLYGILEILDAAANAALQKFHVELTADLN